MAETTTRIAINGGGGRMGQRILALAREDERFEVVAMMEAPDHPYVGKEVGGIRYTATLSADADVVIDFSLPAGTETVIAQALNRKTAMVIGTTGHSRAQLGMIQQAAKDIPIVHAPNMSVGVNVLFKLVAEAAKALGDAYDIEISETHHRFKKDAPSGTALGIARAICEATGKDMDKVLRHGRSGEAPRQPGEIGMHALRMGDVVGEHTASFSTLGETISLSHSAHSRDTFVGGALRAARWVAGRPAGLYSMMNVLGL